jgi:hypothetical protein
MRLAILFTAILATSATSSHAYTLLTGSSLNGPTTWKWPGTSVNLWLDASLTNASASTKQAIYDSVSAWNTGPHKMNILAREFTGAREWCNGRNEISLIAHKADIGNRPGVTFWNYDIWGNLTESDVLLAADWGFTTSSYRTDLKNYSGTKRSLRGVTIHELGHFLGLQHETDTYNIMGDDSTHAHANGASVTYYAGEDATRGLVELYGANGVQDVAVAHWNHCGDSGGYSSHCRNGILEVGTGTALQPYSDDGDLLFQLQRGKSYYVKVTQENNGSTAQTVTLRLQLSPNDIIGSADTILTTLTNRLLTPDVVNESYIKITIPSTFTVGDYWLGAFVDPENTVSEFDESNNRGYLAKVQIL